MQHMDIMNIVSIFQGILAWELVDLVNKDMTMEMKQMGREGAINRRRCQTERVLTMHEYTKFIN